jgi:hypothetical protein
MGKFYGLNMFLTEALFTPFIKNISLSLLSFAVVRDD